MLKNSNSIGQIIHWTNHPPDKSSKWVGNAVSLLGLWHSLLAIPACVPNTSWARNPLMLGRPLYPQGIFLQGYKHSSGMNPDVLGTRWKRAARKGTKGRKFLHVGNAALPCLPCLPMSFLRLLPLSLAAGSAPEQNVAVWCHLRVRALPTCLSLGKAALEGMFWIVKTSP